MSDFQEPAERVVRMPKIEDFGAFLESRQRDADQMFLELLNKSFCPTGICAEDAVRLAFYAEICGKKNGLEGLASRFSEGPTLEEAVAFRFVIFVLFGGNEGLKMIFKKDFFIEVFRAWGYCRVLGAALEGMGGRFDDLATAGRAEVLGLDWNFEELIERALRKYFYKGGFREGRYF